jgi:hypothetical protein
MEGVMAAGKKRAPARRGASERRTAPARGTKARGAAKKSGLRRAIAATKKTGKARGHAAVRQKQKQQARFAPADRVFHLVDTARDRDTGDMRAADVTACCGKPVGEVFAITLDPNLDTEGVPWCPKVVRP